MALFESRKPKWQHKDPAVRLKGVEEIDPGEVDLLVDLVRNDPDVEVRRAAVCRLEDPDALFRLAEDAGADDLPGIIARRDSLLYERIVESPGDWEWGGDLQQITSAEVLAKLAVNAGRPEVRLAAVDRIGDQDLLAEIVRQECGKKTALAALDKIGNEDLLTDLREKAGSKTARRTAEDKLAAIERQRNPVSEQEVNARRLDELVREAAGLLESEDMDGAEQRLAAISRQWDELDPEHRHPAYGEFSRIAADFDLQYKEILARRRAVQEKTARNEQFKTSLKEICAVIERLSCSLDDDAETVKSRATDDWQRLIGEAAGELVPDPSLVKRFTDACAVFDANRQVIAVEKEQVAALERDVEEIRGLIGGQELVKAGNLLKQTEIRLAGLTCRFCNRAAAEKLVTDAAAELSRAESAVREGNLARRREICTELEKLAEAEDPRHLEKRLQRLTGEWRQLSRPAEDEAGELGRRYLDLTAALTERLKTLEHEKDWELWANLTLKEKLTARVAALDREEDLAVVIEAVKQAQAEWKEIGPVPHRESQKLWDAFHSACNRNFERAKPYLEEEQAVKAAAMERRRQICVLAEELAESDAWQQTTRRYRELQGEWKGLPHGPRREERRLYRQFRRACDRFFAHREEYYQRLDEERQGNLVDKEKLCQEAEQLADSPQPDYAGRFKRLQAEWKKIGPVPRKDKDAVWKRFRAACDKYFSWLDTMQQENLQRREELCEAAEKLVAGASPEDDQNELAARLTELQQQWKEIGPVPPDRKEAVWQRFRAPQDQFFAARQEQLAKEEEVRRLNRERKEELLARAVELAGRGNSRQTAEQLQKLQQEWSGIGPAPRGINRELDARFKDLADAFFAGRRQYFIDLEQEQLENQKKKESLCLRLENIVGLGRKPSEGGEGKALSLAEELKQAMEDNFMLAGRRKEKRDLIGEVRRIEEEWQTIGSVPPGKGGSLAERYRRALDAFYQNRRARK